MPDNKKTEDEFERDIEAAMKDNVSPPTRVPPAPRPVPAKAPLFSNPIKERQVGVLPQSTDGYEELFRILNLAYDQSATGKGAERHSVGPTGFKPWEQQPILVNARQVGPGGPAQQVMKKAQEAVTFAGKGNFDAAKADTLGVIVYAAALYKLLEEMEQVQ